MEIFYNKDIYKKYSEIINNYVKNPILTNSETLAVGDIHGSILQAFYPLRRTDIIRNVEITPTEMNFSINYDIENSPVVVFLGDYFHKSICSRSFEIVNSLLKIKSVLGDKLILLIGNHDVAQYIYEKEIMKTTPEESFLSVMNKNFVQACYLEHKTAKPEHIKNFVKAIETGVFKIAYVDNFNNFYSHTVINSNFQSEDFIQTIGPLKNKSSEVGYVNLDFLENFSNCEFSDKFDITSVKDKPAELATRLQNNFMKCVTKNYLSLVNYTNYLHDRPLTKIPIDKNKIMRSIITYNTLSRDIVISRHIIGHTPSFKRHPVDNSKIVEALEELIKYTSNKNFNQDYFITLISNLHAINSISTAQHENLICCDSQALFSSEDITNIMLVEKNFAKYIIGLKTFIKDLYEQPSYQVVVNNTNLKIEFGKLVTIKI